MGDGIQLCGCDSQFLNMKQRTITEYKAALKKHQTFLGKFHLFPEQSRKAIYVQLLQLPLNHHHFIELSKPYPLLPEHTVDKQVAFIVSALGRLYPDLGNQWLPGLIHPFVKLFKEDAIAAFETSLTFLLNWFRPIFDDYPNSSKSIMSFLGGYLPKLQKKVNSFDYPLSAIVQPILLVGLTDILNKDETLQVYDYLVAHPYSPELYLSITAVILKAMEDKLCAMMSIEDIALCLRKEKKLKIQHIIEEAVSLASSQEGLKTIYSKAVFPLATERYPVCQFISQVKKATSKKLQKGNQEEMERLGGKYQKLSKLVGETLRDNQVDYIQDIRKKHQDVEGQLRQYMNQVQEEHAKKWETIRQLEDHFKDKLASHQANRDMHYEDEVRAIERRGRVEREIQLLQEEAGNIREAERAMIRKMEELSLAKKQELIRQNEALRAEQRLF